MSHTDRYQYKWAYNDEERPKECCYDCGKPYGAYPDLSLPDWLWELINPTYHKGCGLLCPTCIANRLDYLNLWYDYCSDAIYFQSSTLIRFRRTMFDWFCIISYPIKQWIWTKYYKPSLNDQKD